MAAGPRQRRISSLLLFISFAYRMLMHGRGSESLCMGSAGRAFAMRTISPCRYLLSPNLSRDSTPFTPKMGGSARTCIGGHGERREAISPRRGRAQAGKVQVSRNVVRG